MLVGWTGSLNLNALKLNWKITTSIQRTRIKANRRSKEYFLNKP